MKPITYYLHAPLESAQKQQFAFLKHIYNNEIMATL